MLASASPRRAALLAQIGVPFRVQPPAVDETRRNGEPPRRYVRRMALAKARAVTAEAPVLGADTVVVVEDRLFGKPADRAAGLAMLAALSGREHHVLTAVALAWRGRVRARLAAARVRFRAIDAEEAAAYWDTGEPADKAGGYGMQGIGGVFARRVRGGYGTVVGLPLAETEQLLRAAGIDAWRWRRPQGQGAGETGAAKTAFADAT